MVQCAYTICSSLQVHADKAARREIAVIEVYCPNRQTGCDWTGPLSSVEEHVAECQHQGVQCPHPGCDVTTTAAMLQQHKQECSYREVECRYCKTLLPFNKLAVCSMIICTCTCTCIPRCICTCSCIAKLLNLCF